MQSVLPAAPGWRDELSRYLEFLKVHRGMDVSSIGRRLRRFTRDVAAGAPRASDCTVACVDGWLVALCDSGVRGTTVRNYVGAVRGFLRWLHDERLLTRDVASHIETPLIWRDAHVPSHFTWKEVQCLIGSVPDDDLEGLRDRALLHLFACSGLRAGEAATLSLDDLDLENGTVRLRSRKSGGWLLLPLIGAQI